MCGNIKTISRVRNGELFICTSCNVYHLEFNNIYFEFTPSQLEQFKLYLSTIEEEYWEQKYACAKVKKKIPIPSMQPNLVLMFNRQEIKELKSLLYDIDEPEDYYLSVDDIDYLCVLN